ncbi:MAG: amidohydrolase family protein, partial [Gammaproteobacteria bacterium]|nr:amidohydrolase family protein [Gammaproteobacteria bacterium]
GPTSMRLGLPATPVQAEEVMIARDLALAELTGGRYHALHVSAARSVALIRSAKDRGVNVTAEVTPHHVTLTDEIVAGRWEPMSASLRPYDPVTKVNPPLRSEDDVQAVRVGLADGTIDCLGTDHAPHADHEKRVDYAGAAAGFSGFETAFAAVMELVHSGAIDLPTLIERLTRGAKVYGLPHGSLAKGAIADVVVLDPDREWVVDVAAFKSRGKNSPFHGQAFRGRVLKTICGGRVVFDLSEDPVETVGALGI